MTEDSGIDDSMIDDSDNERHPVDLLAEEFSARLRRGERPRLEEYAERYPEHADLIRAVFPSVALVERVAESESESSAMSTALPITTPKSFGDFDVVRRIGAGGMGIVYEAIQRSLQRRVALKVMNANSSEHAKHRLRFQREAEAAAGLHHTNIVPIYGYGEDHGLQYYAMQLIDGVTLHEVIECLKENTLEKPATAPIGSRGSGSSVAESRSVPMRRYDAADAARRLMEQASAEDSLAFTTSRAAGPTHLSAPATTHVTPAHETPASRNSVLEFCPSRTYCRNVASIVAKAANAMGYAHHCRILHRDIKPANLLLDRDGTVWVADFGLARRDDVDGATQTGELLGTLRYMAPEQIHGDGDHRMDIFSLGLTLYELLTLQFGLESPKARLLDPVAHSRIRFTKEMQRVVPRDLQTIVLKACSILPRDRYQRAADMEEDLRRFLEDRPILARRASLLEQSSRWARRNPVIATLAATSFGLLLIIAGLLGVWNRQQERALQRIQKEFDRATREQLRAEKNMDMALEAFDQITDNIAKRGGLLDNSLSLVDEDVPEMGDAWLTQADVELLQSLQQFFARFAEENSTDLRVEAAVARRRVGEIQHKIGELDEAFQSLNNAIAEFKAIRIAGPVESRVVLEEVAARQEMIVLLAKRGQVPRATNLFQETMRLLESLPDVNVSVEGKFARAKLIGSMVTSGSRFAGDRRRKPAQVLFGRVPMGQPMAVPPAQLARLKREADFNGQALAILEELVASKPENSAFQIALARALKEQVRIHLGQGDMAAADQAVVRAIDIIESLLKDHPKSASLQFQLAEILSRNVAFRAVDEERCQRGLELCNSILKEHPYVPEYQALKASILARLGVLGGPLSDRGDRALQRTNEAIALQKEIAERYPEVVAYSVAWLQYQTQLSEIYFALKRPEKARSALNDAALIAENMRARGMAQPFVKTVLERIRERRANLEAKNNG